MWRFPTSLKKRRDAKEVIALIEAEGQKAIALPGDIKDGAWCRELVEKTVARLVSTLFINAARQQYREKIEDLSTDDLDKTIADLYALHWIAQVAVPPLPAGASVITTASIQAYKPSSILVDYATTKSGIVAVTAYLTSGDFYRAPSRIGRANSCRWRHMSCLPRCCSSAARPISRSRWPRPA